MSGVSLSAVMGLLDPAPMWRFVVTLPTISGITLGPQFVQHIDLPLSHIMPDDEAFANQVRYHPTSMMIEDINMSLYQDGNYNALNYFEAWRLLIFNPVTGDIGLPIDYKQTITLKALDLMGNVTLTASMYECWPTSRNPLNYDGSHATAQAFNVTLKCEALILNFSPFNGNSNSMTTIGTAVSP